MTYSLEYYFSQLKIPLLIILMLGVFIIILALIIRYMDMKLLWDKQ